MTQLQLLADGGLGQDFDWECNPFADAKPAFALASDAGRRLWESLFGLGSGGVITPDEIFPAAAKVSKSRVRSPQENLKHIRAVLNPSMSELATVVGVSRQAMYNWLKRGNIAPEHDRQLLALAEAADVLAASGMEITPWLLQREIIDGKTLFQICADGGDVVAAAKQMVDVCRDEAQQRKDLDALFADLPERPASEESDWPYVVDGDA